MSVKTKLGFLFTVVILAAVFFTTCETPMGMGDTIDWEAPVLTVDTVPNPYYVRKGSTLTGTVTDNVGVDKMVFLNSATGKELFPVIREGKKWTIKLGFTAAQNGEKIVGQIIAYDKAGNSGDTSIAFITMIIDIKPPILRTLEIKRTDQKNFILMYYDDDKDDVVVPNSYNDLKKLEGTDRKDDLLKYQNGWFYLTGIINEDETRLKQVSLEFYDYREINKRLLSLPYTIDEGSLDYPKWLIKEEELLDAGVEVLGSDYKTKYYDYSTIPIKNGNEEITGYTYTRYYYRVVIKALDMSGNENIQDDRLCICLWADSDKPKGIADPGIVGTGTSTTLSKGTPIPVEFYDDDSLYWAFTGLLKDTQWGINGAAGSVVNQAGSNEVKLNWLKGILTGNTGTDPTDVTLGSTTAVIDWASNPITNQISSTELNSGLDQKLVYLQTGTSSADYGDYILFTIAADKKLSPHDGVGPQITNKGRWAGRVVEINLKDENLPLIVFDTTASPPCPEENTFPQELEGGENFYLVGYTLRENGDGSLSPPNRVTKFRMAWIPYEILGGQDANITAVQNALKDNDFAGMPAGVQYWNFTVSSTVDSSGSQPASGTLKLDSTNSVVSGSPSKYTKQSFRKKFNVMGGADDVKPSLYDNFTRVKGNDKTFENETKLFIFYAQDSSGNEVFRQLPILGFRNNPKMVIYDITYNLNDMPSTTSSPSVPTDIPNPTETAHFTVSTGAPTQTYYGKLNTYNKYPNVTTALKNASVSEISPGAIKESEPFSIYPRGTTLKYWVKATYDKDHPILKDNTIPIVKLTMRDITFAKDTEDFDIIQHPLGRVPVGSDFNNTDKTLSFCEYYPDVTQRTFLFTATDQLGNTASVQRTVAVSNAARLESITTTEQSGTYGYNKRIVLQANFSSQIYVANENDGSKLTDQTKKPSINYRYKKKGDAEYTYGSVTCNTPVGGDQTNGYGLYSDKPTISLTFNFDVPIDADSYLETIYDGIKATINGVAYDRPITVADGTKIMDKSRGDSAFIPGYLSGNITMPNWTAVDLAKTLQGTETVNISNPSKAKKAIYLDGVRPKITGKALVDTKAPYDGTDYYFKEGESISIKLTADKDIRADGSSRLSYTIVPKSGSGTTYYTSFKYQKPVDSRSLIYSLKIDAASCPIDGILTNVTLYQTSDSNIVDNAGNTVDSTTTGNLLGSLGNFYIKRTQPVKPKATLNNTEANITDSNGGLESVTRTDFRGIVTLKIPNSDSATWPEWEDKKQYSIDGGINWLPKALSGSNGTQSYNIPDPALPGTYPIQVRYLDRAGNEGIVAKRTITIGDTFPSLISVNAKQSNGWYPNDKDKSLIFNLNFADTVTVRTPAYVSITLRNRNTSIPSGNADYGKDTITLTTNLSSGYSGTTITFEWKDIADKEMRDGLYISNVEISGLEDKFGITGTGGTGSYTGGASGNGNFSFATNCANLAAGLKVDAITPTVTGWNPLNDKNNNPPAGNAIVKTITLTFREPVMKGSGVITIRPRGNYAIPPVLEDTGYYLGYTANGLDTDTHSDASTAVPTRFSSAGPVDANKIPNRTYISSFYDVYNAVGAADRNALTQSSSSTPSMSSLKLNDRTGQSYGPYKKMTQGLVSGYGYTGNYPPAGAANNYDLPNANAYPAMMPDTATKWVLDYQYSITGTNAEVAAIRTALTNAKWRWQEIDVVNVDIVNDTAAVPNTGTVTIKLNEPLLKGLDWDVFYPEGTFTDLKGNPAPGSGVATATRPTSGADSTNNVYTANVSPGSTYAYVPIYVNGAQYTAYVLNSGTRTFRIYPAYTTTGGAATGGTTYNLGNSISLWIGLDYFFTSPGVQTPVIRVNRRSYDARNSGWQSTARTYNPPPNTAKGGATGWDTIAAVISDKGVTGDTGWGIQDFNYVHYRVESESSATKNGAAISAGVHKGDAGNLGGVTGGWSGNVPSTSVDWNVTAPTRGTWVLPNLIRRTQDRNATASYTIITKSGTPETRNFLASKPLRMFRSYNKDLTKSELEGLGLSASLSNGQGYISFSSMEASKSYVAGSATCNGQTAKGYEGVFRTVIVFHYTNDRNADNFMQIQGSNLKNGMPSVAGFPVRDAEENGDNRFIKVFHAAAANTGTAVASDALINAVNRRSYYWVSTEIVCEWYFISWGNGGTNGSHQDTGEVNNYLTVGYGDLTYGFNIGHYSDAIGTVP